MGESTRTRAAAIEESDLMAAQTGGLDSRGSKETGAAENEDALLWGCGGEKRSAGEEGGKGSPGHRHAPT